MTERILGDALTDAPVSLVPGPRVEIGESPLWVPGRRRLAYVDMVAGALHERDLETGADDALVLGPYLGAVVESASGALACVSVDGVGVVEGASLRSVVRILHDERTRLNDAAVDPWGRLWVGSTSRTGERDAGALHVWEPGTPPVEVLGGMTQPNGIGWSPDRSVAYVVDTGNARVLAAPTDPETGDIGEFSVHIPFDGSLPDGLAVDADGSLWICIWGGSRLDRFAPDGTFRESVAMPVEAPTSCTFVGDGRLVVTSARFGVETPSALAGSLFVIEAGVEGAPVGRLAL